jgi:uncharacterized protein YigE (DUF2233 family)
MAIDKPMRTIHIALASAALVLGCRGRPAAQDDKPRESGAPAASMANGPPGATFVPVAKGVSYARAERVDDRGRNVVWTVLRVAIGQVDLAVVEPPNTRLEQLAKQPTIVAAVNGGFFEADGSASGLLASHGRRMGRLDARAGSGVLVVSQGRASLMSADDASETTEGDVIVQCGPRLVEPDGAIGIRTDDGKRASRTAACIRDGGHELDFVLAWTRNGDRDGPGLFEMAEWLREPLFATETSGCEAALNLDGGPSTGIVLRGMPEELHKPYGRVPWALAVTDEPHPVTAP